MDAAWPGLEVEESNLSVQAAAMRKALGVIPAVAGIGAAWGRRRGRLSADGQRGGGFGSTAEAVSVRPVSVPPCRKR
jgi:hypothetical protein